MERVPGSDFKRTYPVPLIAYTTTGAPHSANKAEMVQALLRGAPGLHAVHTKTTRSVRQLNAPFRQQGRDGASPAERCPWVARGPHQNNPERASAERTARPGGPAGRKSKWGRFARTPSRALLRAVLTRRQDCHRHLKLSKCQYGTTKVASIFSMALAARYQAVKTAYKARPSRPRSRRACPSESADVVGRAAQHRRCPPRL